MTTINKYTARHFLSVFAGIDYSIHDRDLPKIYSFILSQRLSGLRFKIVSNKFKNTQK